MIKIIACHIFKPYIETIDINMNQYEITYLEISQHLYPKKLSKTIQEEINNTTSVEKIILLYGLCGGTLLNIQSNDIPLYILKVHDCLSILLGSKERYKQLFKHRLSTGWSCLSLKEAGSTWTNPDAYQLWVEQYDQETADYLLEQLSVKESIYISLKLEKDHLYHNYPEVIIGDLTFLKDILKGQSKELMQLKQNQFVVSSSDFDEVIEIRKGERKNGNLKSN